MGPMSSGVCSAHPGNHQRRAVMAMVANRGPFRNLIGHILFVRADFSMETRPGGCLNPFTNLSWSSRREVSILYRQKSLSEKLWCKLRRTGGGIVAKPTLMKPKMIKLLVQGSMFAWAEQIESFYQRQKTQK
jgi:hypothetical protein